MQPPQGADVLSGMPSSVQFVPEVHWSGGPPSAQTATHKGGRPGPGAQTVPASHGAKKLQTPPSGTGVDVLTHQPRAGSGPP
jgi:hypothetical protein